MEGTFAEFVKFLTSDPIMLGLCIAVISLVIIFILILFFGDKKNKKSVNNELEKENTSMLLKNDLEDEPLKSTQEFNLNLELDDLNKTNNIQMNNTISEIIDDIPKEKNNLMEPVLSTVNDLEKNIENEKTNKIEPVLPTVNDLEKNIENEKTNKIEPVLPTVNDLEKNIENEKANKIEPVLPTVSDLEKNIGIEKIIENEDSFIDDKNAPITINEALSLKNFREESTKENISIPKPKMEIKNDLLDNISSNKNRISNEEIVEKSEDLDDIELPTIKLNTEEVKNKFNSKINEGTGIQPFSSVYLKEQIDSTNDDNFSKTEIIKHIPKSMDTNLLEENKVETSKINDLELPKLNTDKTNSVLSVLTGETFQINR